MRWATSPDHGARNIHNGSKPEGFVVISIPLSQVPWVGPDATPLRPSMTASPVTVNDCVSRHAVQIEPGLQPPSPRNGNISNMRRRLSAISPWNWPNLESGDRPQIRKSPPLAGISGITEGKISWRRTGWLATQWDSNQSPHKFPANREFYREFSKIWPHRDPFLQETLVPQRFLSQFPTQNNRENICENREFFRASRENHVKNKALCDSSLRL